MTPPVRLSFPEHVRLLPRLVGRLRGSDAARHERHGPVVDLGYGSNRMVLVFGAEANEHVISKAADCFEWGEAMSALVAVDGPTALVVSDGDDHKRRRRLVQPAFSIKRVDAHLGLVVAEVDLALEAWQPGDMALHDRDALRHAARRLRRSRPKGIQPTAGLESGLSFLWIGTSQFALVAAAQSNRRRALLVAAATIGLGPLVRPDLLVMSLVFAVFLVAVTWRRSWRDLLGAGAVLVAAPGLYAFLVRSTPVAVGPGAAPYPPGGTWHEPDLDHAAEQLRLVWDDPGEGSRRATAAQRLVRERLDPGITGPTT